MSKSKKEANKRHERRTCASMPQSRATRSIALASMTNFGTSAFCTRAAIFCAFFSRFSALVVSRAPRANSSTRGDATATSLRPASDSTASKSTLFATKITPRTCAHAVSLHCASASSFGANRAVTRIASSALLFPIRSTARGAAAPSALSALSPRERERERARPRPLRDVAASPSPSPS